VGHGYLASRFVSEAVAGAFSEAGHLHNGFIDTVYNTGLAGLTVLIMMHGVILRNLWRSLRNSPGGNERVLVVGCCALYVNLFINGEFNSTFGGAARPPFMMLLGLLAVTEKLRVMSRPSFVPMPTSCASPPAGKP
jgi:O-antigen ligase